MAQSEGPSATEMLNKSLQYMDAGKFEDAADSMQMYLSQVEGLH